MSLSRRALLRNYPRPRTPFWREWLRNGGGVPIYKPLPPPPPACCALTIGNFSLPRENRPFLNGVSVQRSAVACARVAYTRVSRPQFRRRGDLAARRRVATYSRSTRSPHYGAPFDFTCHSAVLSVLGRKARRTSDRKRCLPAARYSVLSQG